MLWASGYDLTKRLAKLNRVVDKLQTHAELTKKNDLLKVEGETPKLNEQNWESLPQTEQITARNRILLMKSRPENTHWFAEAQKKEHLNQVWGIQFRDPSVDTVWIFAKNWMLAEIKPEAQKILIC